MSVNESAETENLKRLLRQLISSGCLLKHDGSASMLSSSPPAVTVAGSTPSAVNGHQQPSNHQPKAGPANHQTGLSKAPSVYTAMNLVDDRSQGANPRSKSQQLGTPPGRSLKSPATSEANPNNRSQASCGSRRSRGSTALDASNVSIGVFTESGTFTNSRGRAELILKHGVAPFSKKEMGENHMKDPMLTSGYFIPHRDMRSPKIVRNRRFGPPTCWDFDVLGPPFISDVMQEIQNDSFRKCRASYNSGEASQLNMSMSSANQSFAKHHSVATPGPGSYNPYYQGLSTPNRLISRGYY